MPTTPPRSRVHVELQNQGNYSQTIDKYVQSSQSSRPDLVIFPEYVVQQTADSDSLIPIGACLEASGFDTSTFQPSTLTAYSAGGVQWGMPFSVSNPVLYYRKDIFEAAGLDPEDPPQLARGGPAVLAADRRFRRRIVRNRRRQWHRFGWRLVPRAVVRQRAASSTPTTATVGWRRRRGCSTTAPLGVELLTFVQQLINDGLAFNVGDNAGGTDTFFKLADESAPAAMTIGTSAALGTVIAALGGGLIPGLTVDDIGVGPMPGPGPTPTALVGGNALYIVKDKGDEKAAAAWDYITYAVSAEAQSQFAIDTGYVPVRCRRARRSNRRCTKYTDDPRFRVAYDQLIAIARRPGAAGPDPRPATRGAHRDRPRRGRDLQRRRRADGAVRRRRTSPTCSSPTTPPATDLTTPGTPN